MMLTKAEREEFIAGLLSKAEDAEARGDIDLSADLRATVRMIGGDA